MTEKRRESPDIPQPNPKDLRGNWTIEQIDIELKLIEDALRNIDSIKNKEIRRVKLMELINKQGELIMERDRIGGKGKDEPK